MNQQKLPRTRFPPEPNGYLHIGHLKAMLIDFENADCNLRYDDTNPDNESDEYKSAILQDILWLGFKPSFISHTSDYDKLLCDFAEKLVELNIAYYDSSTSDEISKQRENEGYISPYAPGQPLNTNEQPKDNSWCIRVHIDPQAQMTCMRDPVIIRLKTNLLKPTYDFSHPIVDYLEGIERSYCTREFYIRRQLYYYMINLYRTYGNDNKSNIPEVTEFSRLKIKDVDLSKRKILAGIEAGKYSYFNDPKLFTISGLRARGHEPEALIHFCRQLSYVDGDGGVTPMHVFNYYVRDYYEQKCLRCMGIKTSDLMSLIVANNDDTNLSKLYIDRDDFQVNPSKGFKRLAPGRMVWLKHYGLVEYLHHNSDQITVQIVSSDKAKTCKPRPAAIQWVTDKFETIECYDPDNSEITFWLIDPKYPKNTVFQMERCGYYRCTKPGKLIKVVGLKTSYKDIN